MCIYEVKYDVLIHIFYISWHDEISEVKHFHHLTHSSVLYGEAFKILLSSYFEI